MEALSMTKTEKVVKAALAEELVDRDVGELGADRPLRDLNMDSLAWAMVVIKLERELGVDPFAEQTEYSVPNTVGEFVEMYTNTVQGDGA